MDWKDDTINTATTHTYTTPGTYNPTATFTLNSFTVELDAPSSITVRVCLIASMESVCFKRLSRCLDLCPTPGMHACFHT